MGKTKRGRPRKDTNNSSVDLSYNSSKSVTMQENTDYSKQPLLEVSQEVTDRVTIEDWEAEINDSHSLANLELSQSNSILDKQSEVLPRIETDLNSDVGINMDLSIPVKDTYLNTSYHLNQELENLTESIDRATKLDTIIHIVDGEKGGAGKSFVSKALIEYCASINHEVLIVDADSSNQDIAKIYPNVKLVFFSDDEKLAKKADEIFDLAFEKSVIVNLPAQVYSNVTDWIENNDLTELGRQNSISFVKWFVCTGAVDSVNFFIQSLSDLGDKVTHVFVRNQGLCDDWEYIVNMPEFQQAVSKYNFVVMDFPKFPFWERNAIERLGITFSSAIAHPELKVISKQRVKNFLKKAYAAIAQTGLIK